MNWGFHAPIFVWRRCREVVSGNSIDGYLLRKSSRISLLSHQLKPSTLTAVALAALVMSACTVSAQNSPDSPSEAPAIGRETVRHVTLDEAWGQVTRWQIEDADWSIALPEIGSWSSISPLNESGFSSDSVRYTTDLKASVERSLVLEVQRFNRAVDSTTTCSPPTIVTPNGQLISARIDGVTIDGHDALVTRISEPGANGSSTGTYQVCFITSDSMYLLAAAATPLSVEEDLFTMLQTFRIGK